jgi:phosphoglycerol transferase MdoB-like AlkP superfamily enzyme
MSILGEFGSFLRENPVSGSLQLFSLLGSVLMIPLVFLLLFQGVTASNRFLWESVVVAGICITVIWNVLFPVYDRLVDGPR